MKHYLSTLEESMKRCWDKPALCNYNGETFTNAELAENIVKFGMMFEKAGLKKGDHIALCAKNTARWGVAFLAVNAFEGVVVPILMDFHPDSLNHLVDHSDSVLLFTDKEIWDKLDVSKMPQLRGAINMDDFSLIYAKDDAMRAAIEGKDEDFNNRFNGKFGRDDLHFAVDNFADLNVINYTSGTTSAPKGVMLTFGNISASIDFAHKNVIIQEGDTLVSMLPMAHVYGMVFEFLYPLSGGCTVYFFGKTPSPTLLLKAMKEVRPYMICTVPLVLEKVYKSSLKPVLSKWYMKVLTSIPLVNRLIYNKVRSGLDKAFGGQVRHYIMGGAALNPEVENCFKRIRLHYTVGYGMTEAAPLLAYRDWRYYAKGSCGCSKGIADVRIDSTDPAHIPGEIQAKGNNITIGYYKNEEATKAAFTDDGYLHTGDLGIVDKEGNIFIKGRSKCMILSANGQNIYPEELEAILNNQDFVNESLVVERQGKLVALLQLDTDAVKQEQQNGRDINEITEKIRLGANRHLPNYSQIAKIEVMDVPFEKTPKMSIKRFLYK